MAHQPSLLHRAQLGKTKGDVDPCRARGADIEPQGGRGSRPSQRPARGQRQEAGHPQQKKD